MKNKLIDLLLYLDIPVNFDEEIKIIPKLIDNAKSLPRKTAIPLPPLNFNQTGNI